MVINPVLLFLLVTADIVLTTSNNLPFCDTEVNKTSLCLLSQDYDPTLPPKDPSPCLILPVIGIITAEIDDENQSITIFMEIKLSWLTKQLNLTSDSNWYRIQKPQSIWHPSLYFENMVNIRKQVGHGKDSNVEFWFHNSRQRMWYSEFAEITVACQMDFTSFPLDSHECNVTFGAYDFNVEAIKYEATNVAYLTNMITRQGQTLLVTGSTSPYKVAITQIQPFSMAFRTKSSLESKFSQTGFKINLKRKGIGSLTSTLYIPTATFAIFVHISYLMHHKDAIPGRTGLIVTMFLMSSNVYIGVNAPTRRGFSYVEAWIIGSQIPLVLALLEFGLILGIQKYSKEIDIDFKKVDFFSLITSLSFYIVFNACYWAVIKSN